MNKDPRVDNYISSMPDWQQAVAARARGIIHDSDPEVEETIKFGNRPYFVLNGNIAALLSTKDHLNIFIYDPIAPDPDGIINQGHGNATARSIQIFEGDQLNEPALLQLISQVVKNNRAGGWRKLNS